jgi:hypothetical protein
VDKVLYNWRGGLSSCQWNRQASAILAEQYVGLLQSGRVKHRGVTVAYNPRVTPVSAICKKIPERLVRTQFHWKQANAPHTLRNNANDSDADDGVTTATPTAEEQAIQRTTQVRRRSRATKV